MKYFRWWAIFIAMAMIVGMLSVPPAHAQSLPSGSIGTVNQTTTNTYQLFSYSWTAPTTGIDYIGLAFRQDPGYWSVGSFSLSAAGSSTNLLSNPNLQYGGTVNGYGIQAPANWGVWYQSSAGAPPAAGYWAAPGQGWFGSTTAGGGVNTSTSGSWIDGAVGTYDGIYQGFSATAGITYNFSFYSLGTNPYSNPSIMIGIYAGSCSSGTSIFTCTPVTQSGFTAAATPQQTQGTGGAPPPTNPTGPTVVSTSTTNRVTSSVSYGTPTTSTSYVQRQVNGYDAQGFQVTKTYTDTVTTTTTPRYTTTTTTPVTTTTWSDNTTTTADGTPTSSTTTDYVASSTTTQATSPSSTVPWLTNGGSSASFNANPTNATKVVNFVTRTTADSKVNIEQIGNFNTTTVTQSGSKNNYVNYKVDGSSNTTTITQSGTASTQANYVDTYVHGNSNTTTITQTSTGGTKGAFVTVADNNNTVKVQQTDAGNHYAEVNISGGNKNVDILQQGSANHMASVTMTGYAQNLTLQQSGSSQQFYSINTNCASAGGCSAIAVRQGN